MLYYEGLTSKIVLKNQMKWNENEACNKQMITQN